MRIQNWLLASSLVVLYGCQPETPAQPPVTPSTAPAASVEAQAIIATPVAETPSAPAVSEPSVAETTAPAAQETPPAVKEAKLAAPARETAVAAVKAEPAPVVTAIEPEVKTEAPSPELDAMQLAKKHNCLACHAIDKKMVGPAWKEVAHKYRGDAGAEERLMEKIAKGGKGVWGAAAMPANPKVSQADLRTLSRFVLSLE